MVIAVNIILCYLVLENNLPMEYTCTSRLQNWSHVGLPAMTWMQIYMRLTEMEHKRHLYSTFPDSLLECRQHLFIICFPKLRTSGKIVHSNYTI